MPDVYKAKVIHVLDGDTITIEDHAGQMQRVRLFGIDAPELDQPFGKKAKDFLRKRLGNDAWFEVVSVDRYGRLVAMLYTNRRHKRSLNMEMIEAGMAYHFTNFGAIEGGFTAQKYARENRKGVWGAKEPVETPWDYRERAGRKAEGVNLLKNLAAIGLMIIIALVILMIVMFLPTIR